MQSIARSTLDPGWPIGHVHRRETSRTFCSLRTSPLYVIATDITIVTIANMAILTGRGDVVKIGPAQFARSGSRLVCLADRKASKSNRGWTHPPLCLWQRACGPPNPHLWTRGDFPMFLWRLKEDVFLISCVRHAAEERQDFISNSHKYVSCLLLPCIEGAGSIFMSAGAWKNVPQKRSLGVEHTSPSLCLQNQVANSA